MLVGLIKMFTNHHTQPDPRRYLYTVMTGSLLYALATPKPRKLLS